jgi:hypothetical protein
MAQASLRFSLAQRDARIRLLDRSRWRLDPPVPAMQAVTACPASASHPSGPSAANVGPRATSARRRTSVGTTPEVWENLRP